MLFQQWPPSSLFTVLSHHPTRHWVLWRNYNFADEKAEVQGENVTHPKLPAGEKGSWARSHWAYNWYMAPLGRTDPGQSGGGGWRKVAWPSERWYQLSMVSLHGFFFEFWTLLLSNRANDEAEWWPQGVQELPDEELRVQLNGPPFSSTLCWLEGVQVQSSFQGHFSVSVTLNQLIHVYILF